MLVFPVGEVQTLKTLCYLRLLLGVFELLAIGRDGELVSFSLGLNSSHSVEFLAVDSIAVVYHGRSLTLNYHISPQLPAFQLDFLESVVFSKDQTNGWKKIETIFKS